MNFKSFFKQKQQFTSKEIHAAFLSEVNELILYANTPTPTISPDQQKELDKMDNLNALGLINSANARKTKVIAERLDQLKIEERDKADLIEAIDYFSKKYPKYKFITSDSIARLCEKFGLAWFTTTSYTEEIPDDTMNLLLQTKIDEDDECYDTDDHWYYNKKEKDDIDIDMDKMDNWNIIKPRYVSIRNSLNRYTKIPQKSNNTIVAPKNCFLNGPASSKKQTIDPIFLYPVYFKNKRHYLIVA